MALINALREGGSGGTRVCNILVASKEMEILCSRGPNCQHQI